MLESTLWPDSAPIENANVAGPLALKCCWTTLCSQEVSQHQKFHISLWLVVSQEHASSLKSNRYIVTSPEIFGKKLDTGGEEVIWLSWNLSFPALPMTVTQPMASSLARQKTRLIFVVVCGPEDCGGTDWAVEGVFVVICQSVHVHPHLHPLWPARTSKISLILSSLTTCQVKWSVTWVSKGIRRCMAWKHSNEAAGDGTSPLETVRFWVIVVGRTTWLWHVNLQHSQNTTDGQLTMNSSTFFGAKLKQEASTSCPVRKEANQS